MSHENGVVEQGLEPVIDRLLDGRKVSQTDLVYFEIMAGLVQRIANARATIAAEGAVKVSGEGHVTVHPAAHIEKRASQEVRGWIERRPDLFGAQEKIHNSTPSRKARFKRVAG